MFLLLAAMFCAAPAAQALNDRYRCIIRDDPATTMTIGWNQISGREPVVYYGTTDFGVDVTKYPSKISPQRIVHAKGMHNHFARLSNLRPGTVYYFVIQDSEGVSRRYSFKTIPDDHNTRLSILAGGDSRNYKAARINANKMVARLRPDFVLFGGDMTGGDTDREWVEWMGDWQAIIAADGRIAGVIPARGNHERSNQSIYDMFDTRTPDIYYAQTFARGLMRVYTLNSMMPSSGEQRDWLEQDLINHQDAAWRIAQYHHPMRPHSTRKGEHEYLRRMWGNIFFKYRMRLAVECDTHIAKVTKAIKSSNEPGADEGFIEDPNGTYFIGEGGWGAPQRESDDPKRWTIGLGSFNHLNWIFVDLNKIEMRVVRTDNADLVQPLHDHNHFTLPAGIDLWDFNPQACLTIPNKEGGFRPTEAKNFAELASVGAQPKDGKVFLQWTATNESANSRFVVKTSTNKIYWDPVPVATLQAQAGKEGVTNKYAYTVDASSKGGKFYYRVSMIDSAGNERMHRDVEVRALGSEKMDLLTASSSSGQLLVDLDLRKDERVVFEIFDTKLKQVFIQEFPYKRGRHSIPLNLRHLSMGYYLLEISYGEQLIRKNVRITKPQGQREN